MTADLVSFRDTPNGCSETNVSLQIDRVKPTWLPNVHEPLKDDANFSGMSGGPCFRLIPAENRIELAAIIYEGRWDIGIVFARPTTPWSHLTRFGSPSPVQATTIFGVINARPLGDLFNWRWLEAVLAKPYIELRTREAETPRGV